MITEEFDGSSERIITTAFITRPDFLAAVLTKHERGALRSRWANLIADWCLDYYRRYGNAPKRSISSLYAAWEATTQDKDTKTLVERFLGSLSSEYEAQEDDHQISYLTDLCEKLYNEVRVERLEEAIRQARERGDLSSAIEMASGFQRAQIGLPPAIDLLDDDPLLVRTLTTQRERLITLPGAIGQFYGNELSRDSFVAFLGKMKGGKSWHLMDLAWNGMKQGRNVAYYQVGDLSEADITERFLSRAAAKPLYRCHVKYPISMSEPVDGGVQVEFKPLVFARDMNLDDARKAFQKHRTKDKRLKLFRRVIGTVSAHDILVELEQYDRAGWKADIVIIDYAENLGPVDRKKQFLEQVDETWATLKKVSEIRNNLVVTAAQTNKEGFDSYVLTRKNFSKNKMILAHVSAFIGINQTPEEENQQVQRLNFIVRRKSGNVETKCCTVANCLAIARPAVLSHWSG